MTRDELRKRLEIGLAYYDGEEVEVQHPSQRDNWFVANDLSVEVNLMGFNYLWRIKPKPIELWVHKDAAILTESQRGREDDPNFVLLREVTE